MVAVYDFIGSAYLLINKWHMSCANVFYAFTSYSVLMCIDNWSRSEFSLCVLKAQQMVGNFGKR
jgi:hypothetical protein